MTRYSWLLTVQWVTGGSLVARTFTGSFEADGPVSRSATLELIQQDLYDDEGVPKGANILFFDLGPDLMAPANVGGA